METRIIWFSLVPIYACLFLIFIPYTDAGDIETHISRINESETIYYRYMGFLLSLGDNIFPKVIENSYRVYIGSYREYTFSMQRLYVFFCSFTFFSNIRLLHDEDVKAYGLPYEYTFVFIVSSADDFLICWHGCSIYRGGFGKFLCLY